MSKLALFKARLALRGQSIALYPFSAHPGAGGDALDPYSGHPDPEDPDYPGTVPATTYGAAVETKAFVQPPAIGEKGLRFKFGKHGEEREMDMVMYIAGDQTVTVRDKLVHNSTDYEVLQIQDWWDGDTLVFIKVYVERMVP